MGGARYIVAVIEEPGDLATRIVEVVVEFLGVAGLARVRPTIVRIDAGRRVAVVRVEREGLSLLRAALAAYPKPVLRIVKVTGTLRRALRIAESLKTGEEAGTQNRGWRAPQSAQKREEGTQEGGPEGEMGDT